MSHPALTPQLQSITALWSVLISRPAEGRRLSWPSWLGEILRWFAPPEDGHPSSISCGGLESKSRPSSRKSNALTTRLPSLSHCPLAYLNKKLNYRRGTARDLAAFDG